MASTSRKRPILVSVRLTDEQHERVKALAEVWSCSTAEVLRRALLRELAR